MVCFRGAAVWVAALLLCVAPRGRGSGSAGTSTGGGAVYMSDITDADVCEFAMETEWSTSIPQVSPLAVYLDQDALDNSSGVAVARIYDPVDIYPEGRTSLVAVNISTGDILWTYPSVAPSGNDYATSGRFRGKVFPGVVPVAIRDTHAVREHASASLVQLNTQTGQELGDATSFLESAGATCPGSFPSVNCSLSLLHNTEEILIVAFDIDVAISVSSPNLTRSSTIYAFSMAHAADTAKTRFQFLWASDTVYGATPRFVSTSPLGDAVFIVGYGSADILSARNGSTIASVAFYSGVLPVEIAGFAVAPSGSYIVALRATVSDYPSADAGRVVVVAPSDGEGEAVFWTLPNVKVNQKSMPLPSAMGWLRFADDDDLLIVTDMSVYRCRIGLLGELVLVTAVAIPVDEYSPETTLYGAAIAPDGGVVTWGALGMWQLSSDTEVVRSRPEALIELHTGLPGGSSGIVDAKRGVFAYGNLAKLFGESLSCNGPRPPTDLKGFLWWGYVLVGAGLVLTAFLIAYVILRKGCRTRDVPSAPAQQENVQLAD